MIYSITGAVSHISGSRFAVDVFNTGLTYEVVLASAAGGLPAPVQTVYIYTHQPDQGPWIMYGFPDRDTKAMFLELISVPRHGPSKAAALLLRYTVEELAALIAAKAVRELEAVPGIGAKSAKAILAHLEGKYPAGEGGNGAADTYAQAEAALRVLGYKATKAREMVAAVTLHLGLDTAGLIRAALNTLNNKIS